MFTELEELLVLVKLVAQFPCKKVSFLTQKRISQYEVKRIQSIEKDIGLRMKKYKIDEKRAESHLYQIAEKRCHAKIVRKNFF
jgi:hypothetical protein